MNEPAVVRDAEPLGGDYRAHAQALLFESSHSGDATYSVTRLLGAIREGIAMATVGCVEERYQLSEALVCELLGVSASTLKRRRSGKGRLTADESDRFVRLAGLYAMAEDVLGSAMRATEWMAQKNRSLGGESPNAYAAIDTGAREVEDLLGRIAHGIAA